ncbi:hypothetical protein AN396_11355 [Candidatus Epulonipiscium fishelsonii]|jgi:hypothetical protein|uniref:Uncharacterized protein n=1 Tax=Candidatus Epulonipiscium fishelsonii TaxID=77094 RepID=A0ACC8X8D6_9FIRM|nr:hypothetical protein AN396_11355 [Epulopiscium sp. SCG-B11WGA-EpuloA1]
MSSKDLVIQKLSNSPLVKKEYKQMLTNINATLPAIKQSSSNFYKSHSQFMGVMLDVTAITPIRSVKHTLAELDKTRMALEEAQLKMMKKDIELRQKEKKLADGDYKDELERELLETEILEVKVNMNNIQNSVSGAIRKMNFFTNQYKSILKKLGKDDITEEEYEKEEARYHVMTCMKQALNAARARGGVIDEGNLIYLFDMGINSAQAQAEIYAYLKMENKLMDEGKAPTHEMTMQWLEACADKFSGESVKFAERRGFKLYDEESLNTKLLDNKEKPNGKQDS